MSFQKSSGSLRSKAHMTDVKIPVLVGVTALAVVVALVVGTGLVDVVSSDGLTVTSTDAGSAAGEDAEATDGAAEEGEESADGDSSTVFVYVTGAVASPKVCELSEGARVLDAIEAAGGFTDDAATDALNLARVVEDGEQIDVPTEQEAAEAAASGTSSSSSSTSSSSDSTSSLININTATAEELETLPGIGEVTAEKIIADREENGAFATIEDITRVSGIGDKKFEAIEDLICV